MLKDLSHLDPRTAIITAICTLVAVPLVHFTLRKIYKFLKQNTSKVLDAIFYKAGKAFRSSLAMRMSMRHYAKIGLGLPFSKYLQVPGKGETSLLTDEVFVPLKLQSGADEQIYSGSLERVQQDSRVIVIGDPGSGKSSLVKRMFREACHEASSYEPEHRLPILIELKHLDPPKGLKDEDATAAWAIAYLRKRVTDIEGFDMAELFDSYLTGRGILVLLDGLDEVGSHRYTRVAEVLRALAGKLAKNSAKNIVLLTMRTQFHLQIGSQFDDEFPVVYRVQPFSPENIYTFLTGWPKYNGERSAEIMRIYEDLSDRPTLREMCSNPLVLAMYVSNDQTGMQQNVVDTRTAFYSQVVDELLVARRSRQLEIQARSVLREQREALLGRLAFEHLCDSSQPANELSWRRALEVTAEIYSCPDTNTAAVHLRDLARETGLISEEREGESFRFIHLTFCEYLAAKEAAEGRITGWDDLMTAHEKFASDQSPHVRSRLVEVIPFAVALQPRSRRSIALDRVAPLGDREVSGRCFLETQAYDHPSWRQYCELEAEQLMSTPSNSWDDSWLRRLHLFNVVLKDAENWSAAYGRASAFTLEGLFSQLVGDDRQLMIQLFGSYAAVDAAAAMRLASAIGVSLIDEQPAMVISNMAHRPFFALILNQLSTATGKRLDTLVKIFIMAGMRSEVVAVTLLNIPAPSSLVAKASGIEKRYSWAAFSSRGNSGKFSLFGACLTLACKPGELSDDSHPEFAIVQRFREMRPPPSHIWLTIWPYMVLFTVSCGVSFALLASSLIEDAPLAVLLLVTLCGFFMNYIIVISGYPRAVEMLYSTLIDVGSTGMLETRTRRIPMRVGLALTRRTHSKIWKLGIDIERPGFVLPKTQVSSPAAERKPD
jgi:NACHT domain